MKLIGIFQVLKFYGISSAITQIWKNEEKFNLRMIWMTKIFIFILHLMN